MALTLFIFFTAIFLLGFVADPIINLYLDPYDTITNRRSAYDDDLFNLEDSSWSFHLLKGFASLGLLGCVKAFFTVSPWTWYNIRTAGGLGGSRGRTGAGTTGRDRVANISWLVILPGVGTFLYVSVLSVLQSCTHIL